MDDEPKKPAEDIQGILSDLDDILSGIGGAAPPPLPSAPPPAPKPIETPKPIEAAKPVEPPKPIEPPKSAEPPKPQTPPPAPADGMKIELASREGSLPPAKKPDAPKPAAAPKPLASDAKPPLEIPIQAAAAPAPAPKAAEPTKPAEPPKTVEPAKPVEPSKAVAAVPKAAAPVEPAKPAAPAAPAPAPAAAEEIPAGTPKDQIRRVAYVHTFPCAEARAAFAPFLSQAARTISKKPLFLRQVLTLEVDASSDPNAIFEKARAAKAAAIIAVVDGWPPAKVEALSEACSRGGMQFRVVAPADVLKKSTAVDVIVDMMLLPGEA